MSLEYTSLHTVDYRLYRLPRDCSRDEATTRVTQEVPPGWTATHIETTDSGMVFRLESPLPARHV